MKKYIAILLVGLAVMSCTPDDSVESASYNWAGIKTTGVPTNVTDRKSVV